jgi:hypothetical protein
VEGPVGAVFVEGLVDVSAAWLAAGLTAVDVEGVGLLVVMLGVALCAGDGVLPGSFTVTIN